jgi:hypothetical protein
MEGRSASWSSFPVVLGIAPDPGIEGPRRLFPKLLLPGVDLVPLPGTVAYSRCAAKAITKREPA